MMYDNVLPGTVRRLGHQRSVISPSIIKWGRRPMDLVLLDNKPGILVHW